MIIRRALEKRMKEMEASGRGYFYEKAKEGQVIFSTSLEGGRLDLYIDGFFFEKDGIVSRVVFADVSSISSRLSVELFSNAGRSGDLEFYVPLDIRHGGFNLSLSVPFLTYSNVLNILVELKECCAKAGSSSN